MNADPWRQELNRRAREARWAKSLSGAKLDRWEELDRVRCGRSYEAWRQDHGWLQAPKAVRKVVPFVPWPSQLDTSAWLDRQRASGEEAIMLKSRELGATWEAIHKIVHWWLFERGFAALMGSKKMETVDRRGDSTSLFEKTRWLLLMQPDHLLPARWKETKFRKKWDKQGVLKNPDNGSEITGEATQDNFGAASRRSVVFIDEFGRVEDRIARQIWKSVESVGSSLWLIFNPTPSPGHFANELVSKLSKHKVRILDWKHDPTRPKNFRELKILPIGRLTAEEFAEIYECKSGATATGNAFRIRRETLIYHEKTEGLDLVELRKRAPFVTGMDFGTGPKSLAAIGAMIEWGPKPRIMIDFALGWPGKTDFALTALPELEEELKRYERAGIITGDPAGKQTQRDGGSYIADIQSYGGMAWVLLQPVIEPGKDAMAINSTPWKRWAVKLCQRMMDDGTLLVHERCEDVLIWALERWSWNVPDGATVEDIRGVGELLKDLPSHACEAMLYAVTYCLATIRAERARAAAHDPEDFDDSDGVDMYDRLGNR